MRRLLLSATLLLAVAPPASAQWGETPARDLGSDGVATCLRDAGGGRLAVLGGEAGDRGTALFAMTADGLRPDGEVRFGRGLQECPAVAAADSGAAIVAAVVQRGSRDRPVPPRLVVAIREPGGSFGAPVELARPTGAQTRIAASVAVVSDGRAAVAWLETSYDRPFEAMPQRLSVVQRAPGGAFGPPQTLVSRGHAEASEIVPALAFDAAGTLTVAWMRPHAERAHVSGLHDVEVATAAPGRTFGAPQRLAREVQDPNAVSLAVAPDGRALVAYDGGSRVRVHERAAGAAAFAAEPVYATGYRPTSPAVALAADGGAAMAWRSPAVGSLPPDAPSAAQFGSEGVGAVIRPPGGSFGAVQRLAAPSSESSGGLSLYAIDDGVPIDRERERVRAAAAPGGQAAIGWTATSRSVGALITGHVAVASGARFGPASRVGGPVRDVHAVIPSLTSAGPIAAWADNDTDLGGSPTARGRLYVSSPAIPRANPPAPAVALSASPQALYHDEPLVVTARCAAACDLRAAIAGRAKRPETGMRGGAALGKGGRTTPGTVRLRLSSSFAGHIAPRGGGTVRVVVRAAAPGGHAAAQHVLRVPVRRRVPPPFQRPLAVRARRAGDDVIVTWRTAAPAHRMLFVAIGRRTRGTKIPAGEVPAFANRYGRGDRRFRLRLRDVPAVRWVMLHAAAKDLPERTARIVVPVR